MHMLVCMYMSVEGMTGLAVCLEYCYDCCWFSVVLTG
jgi:hypothetical protein